MYRGVMYDRTAQYTCQCMARYLHEARQANIRADTAKEATNGRWAAAVDPNGASKRRHILAEAIRADIMAQAMEETTAEGRQAKQDLLDADHVELVIEVLSHALSPSRPRPPSSLARNRLVTCTPKTHIRGGYYRCMPGRFSR